MEELQWLITKLREWGNGESLPENSVSGICRNIYSFYGSDKALELMVKWPLAVKGAEVGQFIIPMNRGDDSETGAEAAYCIIHDKKYMWVEGEYAELRRELCLWLADELEKDHD